MGKIIAIANQKGGVGKTTTAVNFCASLNHRDKKVLLVDCDPQGNATTGMGVQKTKAKTLYDIMFHDVPPEKAVVSTKYGSIIPATPDLAAANVELVEVEDREHTLRRCLEPLRKKYDYIVIDCPPSLELLTINALSASVSVLIPVQCEFYALEGLTDLTRTIRALRQWINPALDIEGLVLTMYDKRNNLSIEVEETLKKHFPGKVYENVIPRNVRLSEAPSHGKPCLGYDKSSKGTKAYLHMTSEFLKRQKREGKKNG